MNTTLNKNELAVLTLLNNSFTPDEPCFLDEVSRGNFSKSQFAGYIGDLQKKGAFEYIEDTVVNGKKIAGEYALNMDFVTTNL